MYRQDGKNDVLAIEFESRHVSLSSDAYSMMVAFADDQKQPSVYVLLQRIASPSQQDINFGHDQVHLEVNGQDRARYGAIETCSVEKEHLIIGLKEDAAIELGVDRKIHIGLVASGAKLEDLTSFLETLFSGSGVFSQR